MISVERSLTDNEMRWAQALAEKAKILIEECLSKVTERDYVFVVYAENLSDVFAAIRLVRRRLGDSVLLEGVVRDKFRSAIRGEVYRLLTPMYKGLGWVVRVSDDGEEFILRRPS